ncbi:MAG: hypothetical protein II629_00985 [Ruminococcus sp.]|nr:hypothetical protein [Ruminococcus sp.]
MTDKAKTKTILSLICNCVIFFVTTGIFISYFFVKTKLIQSGWQSLRFFTTDSNLLTAVAAALVVVCDIQKLRGKRTDIAKPFMLLKFMGVISLLLTFCTVMCLLVPVYGAAMQLTGTAFHMHVTAPVLSFVSFVFLEADRKISLAQSFLGLVPMALYGTVYFLQVLVFENWMDFYAFNQGGRWYITVPVIFTATCLMCLLVRLLRNKMTERAHR